MKINEITLCNWTKTDHPCYPYRLNEGYVLTISANWARRARNLQFRQAGLTLATLHCGVLTINAGYSIDGATLAPDPREVIPACFVHDFMCQFHRSKNSPFSRCNADQVFAKIMKLYRFQWRWLYSLGVRFGILLPKRQMPDIEIVKI